MVTPCSLSSRLCRRSRRIYCLFDLNEMFDLLHHFTTKKSVKMKNRPPSAQLNSVWADGGRFCLFFNFVVVKWCRRSKNENYAKKGVEFFHTKCLVSRLQTKFDALRKKRPQSVKLKSSQSDNDRPRNNSAPGCHYLIDLILISQTADAFCAVRQI